MRLDRFFGITIIIFLTLGVGMSLINSFNGYGIATAKNLHPEILAQLNDDGDGGSTSGGSGTTTGGGSSTGGGVGTGGDGPMLPSRPNIVKKSLMHYDYDTYPAFSDLNGKIRYGKNGVLDGLIPDRLYTITIETDECRPTDDENDECDKNLEGTYCINAVLGYMGVMY